MNIQDTAKNVGVSPEELMEILQDIDIAVEGLDSDLNSEQLSAICDELGYASMEEALADNVPAASAIEEVSAPVEAGGETETAPVEEASIDEAVAAEETCKQIQIDVRHLACKEPTPTQTAAAHAAVSPPTAPTQPSFARCR